MPIEAGWRAAVFAAAVLATTPAIATPTLSPKVERQVSSPTPTAFQPDDDDEATALARLTTFADALVKRDFAVAYAQFSLSMQAATPWFEWEMNQRKHPANWANGVVKIIRLSWYPDPVGQPAGLYVAFDFRGDRADGTMDCGYLMLHRAAPGARFTVVRTETSEVDATLIEEGVPKVDVLRQLPCYLGPGIATAF